MTWLALVGVALLAVIAGLGLLRGAVRQPAKSNAPHREVARAEALCEAISGEPHKDAPLVNQLLTLGPGTLPVILDQLKGAMRAYEPPVAARVGCLETVAGDFGLAAVPQICDALSRLQPTAPLAPSMIRILWHLGPPGLRAVFSKVVSQPELAPFVPRFAALGGESVGQTLGAVLLATRVAQLPAALDALVGAALQSEEAFDRLWAGGRAEQRVMLLVWLQRWLPLATVRRTLEGVADPDPTVRVEAARLARLLADASALGPLAQLCSTGTERERRAAVRALVALPLSIAGQTLVTVASDPDLEVAVPALLALRGDAETLQRAFAGAEEMKGTLIKGLFDASSDVLLQTLEEIDPLARRVAISLLADRVETDPRARERLIRLAESEEEPDRIVAIAALADAGDPTTPDLLARALKLPLDAEETLALQVAAQRVGRPVVAPVARRLRANQDERARRGLCILRALPYLDAVPSLLRGLEDARSGELEGLLAATLRLGGEGVRQSIADGLQDPRRGLLHPALRYLSTYGQPADLPLLFSLFEQHRLLRSVLLNLIEGQGHPALPFLEARIQRGGDDATLAVLERRRDVLKACLRVGSSAP